MSANRKLRFEALEGRRVCAGNVTAEVVGNELVVTGGSAANYVSIQEVDISGEKNFLVQGVKFNGEFDSLGQPISDNTKQVTKINGVEDVFLTPSAGLGLKVSMNGGNDAIAVGGATGPTGTFNTKSLKISGGANDDFVFLTRVNVAGQAGQLDYINTTQAAATSPTGLAEAGKDAIGIDGLNYAGGGKLTIGTGGGVDKLAAQKVVTSGATTSIAAFLGEGEDLLVLNTSNIGNASLSTGGGKDLVLISDTKFKTAVVDLGAGNQDLIRLTNVQVSTKATLRGGAGTGDRLDLVGTKNSAGPGPIITGFEISDIG